MLVTPPNMSEKHILLILLDFVLLSALYHTRDVFYNNRILFNKHGLLVVNQVMEIDELLSRMLP